MAGIWKVNQDNTVVIDLGLSDIYGVNGFELFTKYADETAPVKQDVNFLEQIEDISDPVEVTAQADAPEGTYEIKIDDTSKVTVGMRLEAKDGDGNSKGIIYVSKITDDSIITRRALTFNVATDDKLDQVGNMGIYEAVFVPEKIGPLTFVIANPGIGLQNEVAKVEVVSNTVDDVVVDVNSKFNDLDSKIEDIRSALGTAGASIVRGRIIV